MYDLPESYLTLITVARSGAKTRSEGLQNALVFRYLGPLWNVKPLSRNEFYARISSRTGALKCITTTSCICGGLRKTSRDSGSMKAVDAQSPQRRTKGSEAKVADIDNWFLHLKAYPRVKHCIVMHRQRRLSSAVLPRVGKNHGRSIPGEGHEILEGHF